ncbi:MAG: hypothetical protein HQK49_12095 [Oligoflexia bacterium]|nr:hypothetical protein [Oligoflexia bacterium]
MIKKFIRSKIILIGTIICIFLLILNIPTTVKYGVNYQLSSYQIPLYLKTLNFFYRHYNYKFLVRRIINEKSTSQAQVKNILNWTYQNIRPVPKGFPIKDDHLWNVIISGYGAKDQISDVFATLCNYAGFRAFYTLNPDGIYNHTKDNPYPTYVEISNEWHIFNPNQGIEISISENDRKKLEKISFNYLENHSNNQTPFYRILYYLNKLISRI